MKLPNGLPKGLYHFIVSPAACKVFISPLPPQHLLLPIFFYGSRSTAYVGVSLMSVSLMTNDAELLFRGLLVISRSSVKCLFKPFSFNWVVGFIIEL